MFRLFKPAINAYVKVSVTGATIGALGGGVVAAVGTFPMLAHGMQTSRAKTNPGQFADGVEAVGKLWLTTLGMGAVIGGAPVTYPLAKVYEKFHDTYPLSAIREQIVNLIPKEGSEVARKPR